MDLTGSGIDREPCGGSTPEQAQADAARTATLRGWAMREMAPWRLRGVDGVEAERLYAHLGAKHSWAAIYRFANGGASLADRPGGLDRTPGHQLRAALYLDFFKDVARGLPKDFQATICLNLDDQLWATYDAPVFCFQKSRGSSSPLVPDIDFLGFRFYEDPSLVDNLPYETKSPTAVFSGGTSGGVITTAVARTLSLPRLRAAKFFENNARVDFRLPVIEQVASPEARQILERLSFCRKPRMEWPEQLRRKFVLSMDGNGATCSRVVIALRSNSVLLKYASEDLLYYFDGLQPWIHYAPVASDADVEAIMDMEAQSPELFKEIALAGRGFVSAYLSRAAVYEYTRALLLYYKQSLLNSQSTTGAALSPRPPAPRTSAFVNVVAHLSGLGNVEQGPDGWAGRRGGGRPVEGFAIAAGADPAALTYQALKEDGALSQPVRLGRYCGTQGLGEPIFGFLIRADGETGRRFEVAYEGQFLDGSRAGPLRAPELCRSASNAPLEAMRVTVRPIPADRGGA